MCIDVSFVNGTRWRQTLRIAWKLLKRDRSCCRGSKSFEREQVRRIDRCSLYGAGPFVIPPQNSDKIRVSDISLGVSGASRRVVRIYPSIEQKVSVTKFIYSRKRGKNICCKYTCCNADFKYKSFFTFFFGTDLAMFLLVFSARFRSFTLAYAHIFAITLIQISISMKIIGIVIARERHVFSVCRLWKWIKRTPHVHKIIRSPYQRVCGNVVKYIRKSEYERHDE